MILVVGHPSLFYVFLHTIQSRGKCEITLFTGNCLLVIQICLYILILKKEIQHFICSFLILTVIHHTELKVNSGIQFVF